MTAAKKSRTGFAIPEAALQQHILLLGKTRSGKSSAMRAGFVEPLLEREKPVCIIDPKGDWWGIKSSADGTGAGYPVVIFGGEHADVPINEHSGGPVAELVATGNRPCLIDLGGWMVGARTRFFIDFAAALFRMTRGQRWLVIDECHNFAPQGSTFRDPDRAKMLHWANRLASEGLGRGINMIAASQRPQKVHKDFVTSFETLIAMRVIHKLDRDAVRDWVDGCGDPALGKQLIGELASMDRGEAWVWSPEIDFGPKRIRFKMFHTYDSFKPRRPDEKALKGWADVDLEEVKEKLAAVVAEAEANDPKVLKRRIAELERQLRKPAGGADPAEVAALNSQVEQLREHARVLNRSLADAWGQLTHVRGGLVSLASRAQELADGIREPEATPPAPAPRAAQRSPVAAFHAKRPPAPTPARPIGGNGKLGKGEAKILTAIAQHDAGVDREQLSVLTGYKRSSRDTYIQRLAAAGLVDVGPPITATPEGIAALGSDFEPLPTGLELQAYWLDRLSGGEREILKVLIDVYPNPLARDQISEFTAYKRSSRDTYIQRLRSRKLVDVTADGVVASDTLF